MSPNHSILCLHAIYAASAMLQPILKDGCNSYSLWYAYDTFARLCTPTFV